ncbi:MAG: hypothetical protein ACO1Q7_12200, partial [Gemmatimonas sp.]
MAAVFESVVQFLFKYPTRVFERGDFLLAPVIPPLLLGLLALAGVGLVVFMYRQVKGVSMRDRLVLGTLRLVALLLVLGCLARPTVVLSSAVPQRNLLAVVLDDSRSMKLKDVDGASRLDAERKLLADSSDIVKRLSERFALRFFRFGADAHPATGTGALTGNGTRSDLASALNTTREELAGLPLSGVVVMSDGADNGGSDLAASLLALRARRVPVYTIGVGQERFARDIAVERISAPPSILAGASTIVEAVISLRGVKGEKTTVSVEANGRIITTEETTLPERGDVARVRLRMPPMEPGTYRLAVKAKALDKETVVENNELHTVLEVRPGPARILYVEGEPRPEFAFLRRAVQADSALQVVGLMRSAEKKYLRLGVRDSLELIAGFPTTREELFKYRGIILGSIEASFFTGDQMRMINEFVNLRGGGLLALGGRAAFAEGDFNGTPIADVLPLSLDRTKADTGGPAMFLKIRPTQSGLQHAALQLRGTEAASAARWDSLPPLTSVNNLGSPRSGATVLLNGVTETNVTTPVLAFQRYGRGTSAILGVQDTWLWKMDASIAVEDVTFATFWRQLLRWLIESSPDQIELAAVPGRVGPGESVTLRALVNDSAFVDVNNALVSAHITSPTGRISDVPLEWSLREDGSYTGKFVAEEAGVYKMVAEARRGRDTTRSTGSSFLADDQGADVEQAELRTSLLRRVAQETGGRYYPMSEASRLPEDVVFTDAGVTVRDARDLWDMPI